MGFIHRIVVVLFQIDFYILFLVEGTQNQSLPSILFSNIYRFAEMPEKENSDKDRKKRALILGNGKYTLEQNRLGQTRNNCSQMKKLLEEMGFDVKMGYDLPNSDLIKLIRNFTGSIRDGDLVLVYYSGHACHAGGKNVLIPSDDATTDMSKDLESRDFTIDIERQLEVMKEATPSYALICLLDCYRSYFLKKEGTYAQSLRPFNGPDGALIQYCSSADRMSSEQPNIDRYSLYTKHLLENIAESDIHVADMLGKVGKEVWSQSHGTMRPVTMNKLGKFQNVYLKEEKFTLPNIAHDAMWKKLAVTIAGGFSIDDDLADMIDAKSPRLASCYGPGRIPFPRRPVLRRPPRAFSRLDRPESLCLNNNKTIFIADSGNHRVMEYEDDEELYDRMARKSMNERILCYIRYSKRGKMILGKTITSWLPLGLSGPSDIIYDNRSKKLIIADYHNRRILRCAPDIASPPETIAENIECRGLAIDSKGNLYASDTELHEVRRFEPNDRQGTIVAGGHGQGGRRHQLNHPTYICIGPNDALYISDSCNDRVMKYEQGAEEGELIAGGHGKGLNLNQLDHPTGLLVDQSGTIYVADYWNHRVMRWYQGASHGERIAGVRRPGDDSDQLNGPEGIAFDNEGNLYVSDSDNHRIQRFDIRKP